MREKTFKDGLSGCGDDKTFTFKHQPYAGMPEMLLAAHNQGDKKANRSFFFTAKRDGRNSQGAF
jgi:hypothetical protein